MLFTLGCKSIFVAETKTVSRNFKQEVPVLKAWLLLLFSPLNSNLRKKWRPTAGLAEIISSLFVNANKSRLLCIILWNIDKQSP